MDDPISAESVPARRKVLQAGPWRCRAHRAATLIYVSRALAAGQEQESVPPKLPMRNDWPFLSDPYSISAPAARISSQARAQSPACKSTPRQASRSTRTAKPPRSASSTVNLTQ